MRGYFAIGVEGISKSMNAGSLFRTAHAFGASFVFTVAAQFRRDQAARADTSDTPGHVPYYNFADVGSMLLPADCVLVGVELDDRAVDLPTFRHPGQAAYVLGPERGRLSEEMLARCQHVVRIPTQFCINVAIAGAIVMYDRQITLGRFAKRPLSTIGPVEDVPKPVFGGPRFRRTS
jgi:tRNA G18 (ribose-2'-O)-methylase SpoU